ncbi:hypothetical protein BKA61DRAFT_573098 [Leptodontidium sp. MPI-SDFR-AT-0119]|nr:hypothetical protein BKA61DRAFT_573098 [Leptodontidium sp. MPI-SDFR-AT-0119]
MKMMSRTHADELSANNLAIAAFASLPPNDETMAHNVNKNIITKAGDDMERPLPKQYPARTSAALNTLLSTAKSYRNTRNEKLRSHRTNVVFPAFQGKLVAAGLENDLITDVEMAFISYLLKPLPEIILSFTKSEFDARNPIVEDKPWVPKTANLTDGCIIRFKDGEIAHVWLPDALDEFYRGVEDHQPLEPLCIQWDKDGPWCQSVTERSNGGLKGNSKAAERVAALKIFETRLAPVEDALSALYKVVAPKTFAEAKKHQQFLVEEKTGLEVLSPDQCTSTFVHVKNQSVVPHKDRKDFCLQELGYRLKMLSGDSMLINARFLAHCLCHIDGERTCLVFLNKSSKDNLVKHLLASSREKKKRVKGLKDAGLVDQAAAAEEQPTPFFYPFMRQEQNRWEKDPTSDPFVPLAAVKREQKRRNLVDQED